MELVGKEMSMQEVHDVMLDILDTIVALCEEHGLRYYIVGGTLLGAVRHKGFIPWDDDVDIAMPRDDFEQFHDICKAKLPSNYRLINWKEDWAIQHDCSKLYDLRTASVEDRGGPKRLGVRVDIFPLDGVPKNRVARRMHYMKIRLIRNVVRVFVASDRKNRVLWQRVLIKGGWVFRRKSLLIPIRQKLEDIICRYAFCTSNEVCNYLGIWREKEFFPKAWIGKGSRLVFEGRTLAAFHDYERYLTNVYGNFMLLPPPEERRSRNAGTYLWI